MLFMGIDPGMSGGIAVLEEDGSVRQLLSMPKTLADLATWFSHWGVDTCPHCGTHCGLLPSVTPSVVCMELVGGYKPGSGGNIGSAMFNFGRNVGHLEMACQVAGLNVQFVPPRVWQSIYSLQKRVRGEPQSAFKKRLVELARRLFPTVKVTNNTADALLIALYCQRKVWGQV